MNVRTFTTAILIIFCLLFSSAATAQANVSGKRSIQTTAFLCFEPVEVDGWLLTLSQIRPDRAGGLHTVWQTVFHGTGQGLYSGYEYQWSGTTSSTHIQNAAGGEARTLMQRIHLISQGPLLNNHVWVDIHFTITPDQTEIVDWWIFECAYF